MDNPFNNIISVMKEEGKKLNPPSIILATVTHIKVAGDKIEEIRIKFNNIEVDEDNIVIADYLMPRVKRRYKIPKQTVNDDSGKGEYSHFSFNTDENKNGVDGVDNDGVGLSPSYTEIAEGQTELVAKHAPTHRIVLQGFDHYHEFESMQIKEELKHQPFESEGHILLTDTLRVGDLVAVMSTVDRQTYFILARVVRLG